MDDVNTEKPTRKTLSDAVLDIALDYGDACAEAAVAATTGSTEEAISATHHSYRIFMELMALLDNDLTNHRRYSSQEADLT